MRRRLGGDDIGRRLGRLPGRLDNQWLPTLPDNQTLVRRLLLRVKLLLLLLAKRRADILQRGTVCGLLLDHLPLHLLGLVHHRTPHGLLLLKILLLLHGLLLLEILLHIGLKVILLLLLRHHIIKGRIVETAASQIILVLVLVKGHLVVKAYHVLLLVHGLVHALLASHHVGLVHTLLIHHPPALVHHPVPPIYPVSLLLSPLVVHSLLIVLLLLVWLLLVLETALLLVLLVVATTSKEAPTSKHGRAEFLLASGS